MEKRKEAMMRTQKMKMNVGKNMTRKFKEEI
jgi:hypothetical protein